MEELEHEMERYHWNILGLSETRWKNQGEQRLMKDIGSATVGRATIMNMG